MATNSSALVPVGSQEAPRGWFWSKITNQVVKNKRREEESEQKQDIGMTDIDVYRKKEDELKTKQDRKAELETIIKDGKPDLIKINEKYEDLYTARNESFPETYVHVKRASKMKTFFSNMATLFINGPGFLAMKNNVPAADQGAFIAKILATDKAFVDELERHYEELTTINSELERLTEERDRARATALRTSREALHASLEQCAIDASQNELLQEDNTLCLVFAGANAPGSRCMMLNKGVDREHFEQLLQRFLPEDQWPMMREILDNVTDPNIGESSGAAKPSRKRNREIGGQEQGPCSRARRNRGR